MFHRKRSGSGGDGGKPRSKPGAKPFGVKQAAQKPAVKGKNASVKNQIRAVTRLLNKGGLEPKAVAAQQQRLQELKDSLEDHQTSEQARKYAIRYHKVRFFERVKLERRIQKLEKQPVPEGDVPAATERAAQLASLKDDLLYVTQFPKEEKYVSILKRPEDPAAAEQVAAEVARLRKLVHARAQDAALVADSDEGRSLAHPAAAFQGAAGEADSEEDDFFLDDGAASPDEEVPASGSSPALPTGAPLAQGSSKKQDFWSPDKRPAGGGGIGGGSGKPKQARREGDQLFKSPRGALSKPARQQAQHSSPADGAARRDFRPHSNQGFPAAKQSFGRSGVAVAASRPPQQRQQAPQRSFSNSERPAPKRPQPVGKPQPVVASASRAAVGGASTAAGRTRAEGGRKRRKK
mmetsp:Transcript_1804/g.5249  ORF Transcript_1804/g.5249 Transcript_1804/m.5249 type:complete len:406 (-) Transcript_1804:271-1488(-)